MRTVIEDVAKGRLVGDDRLKLGRQKVHQLFVVRKAHTLFNHFTDEDPLEVEGIQL
jgi:hypothetical protein